MNFLEEPIGYVFGDLFARFGELRFFEIYRSEVYVWKLIEGVGVSISLTVLAGILGFLLAILLAAGRTSNVRLLNGVATLYIEAFRNTPLLVQLFIIAFALPGLFGYQMYEFDILGYRIDAWMQHALISLTLNFAAYFAEILRAGFQGVPQTQIEAGQALGLRPRKIFWKVRFPQAVATMYPSLNAQFIFLFLTTGVISAIGVTDLTHAGKYINDNSFRSFEVYFTLFFAYILIALSFKRILQIIHDRAFKWRDAK